MTQGIMGRSDEASKGQWNSIEKVRGLLVSVERVPPSENASTDYGPPKDQAEIVLEDAIILQMAEGEIEPELRDDRFVVKMNYAAKGKEKSHVNSFFTKGFCASAEEVCKEMGNAKGGWQDLVGSVVTLESQTLVLFQKKSKDEDGEDVFEDITGTNYVFVADDGDGGAGLDDHLRNLLVGKTPTAVTRALLMDARARRVPDIKTELKSGALAERLGLEVVDGVFA